MYLIKSNMCNQNFLDAGFHCIWHLAFGYLSIIMDFGPKPCDQLYIKKCTKLSLINWVKAKKRHFKQILLLPPGLLAYFYFLWLLKPFKCSIVSFHSTLHAYIHTQH